MEDSRIDRLDTKLDNLKDSVYEFKADVKCDIQELRSDLKDHMQLVEKHVAGDNALVKVFSGLLPLIPELSLIIDEHKSNKILKQNQEDLKKEEQRLKKEKYELVGKRLGVITAFLSLVILLVKYFLQQ